MSTFQKSPQIFIPHWRLKWGWRKRPLAYSKPTPLNEHKELKEFLNTPIIEEVTF